jgi:hypothetical protein
MQLYFKTGFTLYKISLKALISVNNFLIKIGVHKGKSVKNILL